MSSGSVRPLRSISRATWTISSQRRRDESAQADDVHFLVNRRLHLFARHQSRRGHRSRNCCSATRRRRMFLPMSSNVAFDRRQKEFSPASFAAPADFSASRKGCRYATAFFAITRADLTTCGKNILPEPNRSPTTFMPAMSGPLDDEQRLAVFLARFLGVGVNEIHDAFHESACDRRSSTVPLRHSSSTMATLPLFVSPIRWRI